MTIYEEKVMRMREHLKSHPADYQTRISLLKNESDIYMAAINHKRNMGLKKIAQYRKEREDEKYQ